MLLLALFGTVFAETLPCSFGESFDEDDPAALGSGGNKVALATRFDGQPAVAKLARTVFPNEAGNATRHAAKVAKARGMLEREAELLASMGKSPFVARLLAATEPGLCQRSAIVVERVNHPRLDVFLRRQRPPLCVRRRLALDALLLCRDLEREGPFVFCDWKADQFAVSGAGRLVLVDVDSLELAGTVSGGRRCSPQRRFSCMGREAECFQWSLRRPDERPVPGEALCPDDGTRKCRGFDARSNLFGAAASLLGKLLPHGDGDGDAEAVVEGLLRRDPADRTPPADATAAVERLFDDAGGQRCVDAWAGG